MSVPVYYRLTNDYNGPTWALDVVPDNSGDLSIARAGDYSGQYWRLVQETSSPPKFHLKTLYKGEEYSLDIINDGTNDTPHLAKSGNYSGQHWTLHKVENSETIFKLSNDFTGKEKFLDVYPHKMKPRMAEGKASGMNWTLTVVKIGN